MAWAGRLTSENTQRNLESRRGGTSQVGANRLRTELDRAATAAGIGHVTPHQLRHTYATALVNAGVSLQALMAILGHVSAEMTLRCGDLFDTTIRAEYERALHLAKQSIGALPTPTDTPPGAAQDCDWRTRLVPPGCVTER